MVNSNRKYSGLRTFETRMTFKSSSCGWVYLSRRCVTARPPREPPNTTTVFPMRPVLYIPTRCKKENQRKPIRTGKCNFAGLMSGRTFYCIVGVLGGNGVEGCWVKPSVRSGVSERDRWRRRWCAVACMTRACHVRVSGKVSERLLDKYLDRLWSVFDRIGSGLTARGLFTCVS